MTCSFSGCDRKIKARGLCTGHYSQKHERGVELAPLEVRDSSRACLFEKCGRRHYANGLCNAHWQQARRGESLAPIYAPLDGPCVVRGCGRDRASSEFCQAHYRRARAGEDLGPIGSRAPQAGLVCLRPDCGRPAVSHELCETHRGIIWKYSLTTQRAKEIYAAWQCEVCGTDDFGTRGPAIDHDHACCPGSGSCGLCVRGLLCHGCNRGLGQFKDSVEHLRRAADYLERSNVAA